MRSLVVNLYGGPGTGKSTTAAHLFALLKMDDLLRVELCREYAKGVVYEDRLYLLEDQLYIFAKQNRKMARLNGKVDFIITDSPLLMSYHYSGYDPFYKDLVLRYLDNFNNIHIFLERVKPYRKLGRIQTKKEAIEMDEQMKGMLMDLKLDYLQIPADPKAASEIRTVLYDRRKKIKE
jgi:thymidylate kinase